MKLVENLDRLETELNSGAYKPSRSVCFVNLKPKPREIFAQYGWHRWSYPQTVILFQVGFFHEMYDRQARWAENTFGLKPQKPRMENRPRVGVASRALGGISRKIISAGFPVLIVKETGYPLNSLRERLPFELLVPTVKQTRCLSPRNMRCVIKVDQI